MRILGGWVETRFHSVAKAGSFCQELPRAAMSAVNYHTQFKWDLKGNFKKEKKQRNKKGEAKNPHFPRSSRLREPQSDPGGW